MRRPAALVYAVFASLLMIATGASAAVTANYPDFDDVDGLQLNGTAVPEDGAIILTDGQYEAGSFFTFDQVIDPSQSFKVSFSFKITGLNLVAGDGLAFVMHSGTPSALGGDGGGLGYSGIDNSLAVEFDIYQGPGDPVEQHIGLTEDGNQENHLKTVGVNGVLVGKPKYVWVDYKAAAEKLRVFYARKAKKPRRPALTQKNYEIDLAGGQAVVGFTSGTGQAAAQHEIRSLKVSQ